MKKFDLETYWCDFPVTRRRAAKEALISIIQKNDISDIGLEASIETLWNICRGDSIKQNLAWAKK